MADQATLGTTNDDGCSGGLQTTVGGPHTRLGRRKQVGNVGEKHPHRLSVCLCHVGAILAVSCCQQDARLSHD